MTRYFSIFGDSISTYEGFVVDDYAVFYNREQQARAGLRSVEDTWWMQVIRAYDGELLVNAAWSGSMLEGACFPCGNSDERVAALALDGQAPDDILVYIGINDYGWGSPHAQAKGGSSATPFCLGEFGATEVAGDAPADAARLFGEAYRQMLDRMKRRYPEARIWCFTMLPGRVAGAGDSTFAYNFRGVPFRAYNEAIVDAARDGGAIACDIASLGFDYEAIEGTHPTKVGMRQMAELMLNRMHAHDGVDTPLDSADLLGYESTDPCVNEGRSCVGCEFALSTGNSWMHVCQAHYEGSCPVH